MTSRQLRLLFALFVTLIFFAASGFGQGSKMKSEYDPIEEGDQDRPDKRAEWMRRGREASEGRSAAALRLRAHRQKMAMRAEREAAAARAGATAAPTTAGWVALGPAPLVSDNNFFGLVSGRATSVAIDPSDPTGNTVYLGGAYGGVWKSANAAASPASNVIWTPVTDQQASLATGAVSVKPDGTVVLVGTGEPNNAIDSYYGVGILRSTDDGANWTLIPSADGVVHPFAGLGVSKFAWSTASSNIVVAATATTAKGFEEGNITPSTNRGLYRSADSGQTWSFQALPDGGPISATDVVYDAVAGKFVAAVRSHGLYSSSDGTNWTRPANQPTPLTSTCSAQVNCPIYRGQLAVVPGRDEMYLWFVNIDNNNNMVDEGIWRSVNGGTWTKISETGLTNCGDSFGCGVLQSFYNLEIAAVPDGSGITDLYAGTINLYKCKLRNNQTTCSTVDANLPNAWLNLTHVYGTCSSKARVHPDEHGMDIAVVSGKAIMYFANDGGIYRALDGYTGLNVGSCNTAGNNQFDDLNGTLGSMTQFVSFSIHPTDQNTVLGGTQDNGSPASNAATSNPQWITVNGGDGGYSAINPTTPTQWFTANTDVTIQSCNSGIGCNTNTFIPVVTNATVAGDAGPFYTPYILDPQNSGELLVGTCRVWRGSTAGTAFSTLSVNFDTLSNTLCTGNEFNLVRGLDAGGPKQNNFSNVVYATTEGSGPNGGLVGGEVWSTTNAATSQMLKVTGAINPLNYTISSVAVDGSDPTGRTAFVGIMGFGVGHVFKTENAGGAWTDWTGTGLPDSPVNALLVDSAAGQMYAATDVGVFVSPSSAASWTEVGPDAQPGATGYLPNVPVSAIRLFNSGGTRKLRVSTYGRGIWEFAVAVAPDFTNAISDSPQTIFPSQNATFHGTLAVQNGYNSAVNLTCTAGGTPPPTTCTLNPTQVPAPGSGTYTMTAAGAVGDYSFNAHAVGMDVNTKTHDAAVTLRVVDFGLTDPNPATVTAQQGGTSNSTSFQVTAAGSFSGTVALTCTGAVITAGATCNFLPSANVNPTSSSSVNASVTVTVPASVAVNSYTVTISASTANPPATKTKNFTLTVTAPPNFTWTGGGSHTVLAGQTTLSYDFTATPVGGGTFTTAVTFGCSNLPDVTITCIFNPTQIAAGAGATPVSLTITTKGPNPGTGAAAQRRADRRSPWLPLTLPIAGIVMVGIVGRRVSRHPAIAGLCLVLGLLGMLACGGGGSSGPPPPQPISVTVKLGVPPSLFPNQAGWPAQTAQFTASVKNSSNQSVTWAVTGGSANGTIDPNGLYTAPAVAPGLPAAVSITATSQADSSKSGSNAETLSTPTTLGTFPNITVSATEGVVTHSQTVSLTVQ
jgi:hypothetical protein